MNTLTIIQHKEQRVLTTQQLAEVYETESKNIQMNFSNNKERFFVGRDYYLLEGDDLRAFKNNTNNIGFASNINKLYLWTERGANRHCKILDTDKAWQQFDVLEETYFRIKQQIPTGQNLLALAVIEAQKLLEQKDEQIAIMKPKADFFDAVAESKDAIDLGSAAKVLNMGIGRNNLFELLRNTEVLMQNNQPYQRYIDCGYFRTIEQKYSKPDGSNHISIKTLVYQKGLNYIKSIIEKSHKSKDGDLLCCHQNS